MCVVNEAVGEATALSSFFLNKSLDAVRCPVAAEFIYLSVGASSSSSSPAPPTPPSGGIENAELLLDGPSGFRRLQEVRK